MEEEKIINNKQKLNTEDNTCPHCGGKTEFDPKTQMLHCPYCNSSFEVSNNSNSVNEIELFELFGNTTVWNDAEVIECKNCGSKEIVNKGKISSHCAFCGTTNIVKTSEIVGMKPHGICPFEKTSQEALQITKNWVKKKKFAPNVFKKKAVAKDLSGIYASAFTFDSTTQTEYKGVLAEDETYTTRDSQGRTHTHTKTRTFRISGNYDRKFDDFLVQASSSIPGDALDGVGPFPTGTCLPYSEKYLAGYTANTYSKDGKQTWKDCQLKMEKQLRCEILRKYHYDRVVSFNANTSYSDTKFKYLLLPVYVGHHIYKGKKYDFFINGSTGKINGKTPVSGWKIFFTVLGILGIVAFIILLLLLTDK